MVAYLFNILEGEDVISSIEREGERKEGKAWVRSVLDFVFSFILGCLHT